MHDDDPPAVNDEAIEIKLSDLRQRHRDLDDAIYSLETSVAPDLLQIQRLKKLKLRVKDEMERLFDQINPDIIA